MAAKEYLAREAAVFTAPTLVAVSNQAFALDGWVPTSQASMVEAELSKVASHVTVEAYEGGHHHHDDHEDHESHSEMVASYSYSCKELTKLSSIKVALFDVFPGIHKINTMWVMDSKQGSATLTAKIPTATFR